MEPFSIKVLSSLLSGLIGLVLPLVSLGAEPQRASQGAVDLLGKADTGGTTFLPEKAEALNIKPEVARKFYERTIAGNRFREGPLNWELLMRLIKDKPSGPIILKLIPGVEVKFIPKHYEPLKGRESVVANKYRWYGRVTKKGKVVGDGLFIIDEKQRKITATIQYNDKVYEIVSLKNGNVRVLEVKGGRFPDENSKSGPSLKATPDHQDTEAAPAPGDSAPSESITQPCLIDVLVLYTKDAEDTWQRLGYDDIWMEFDKAIEITNEAFAHSDIRAEIRIADRKLVSSEIFQESGSLETDLGKLQDRNYLGEAANTWRNEVGADLVNLWVSGGDWCGASPYFTKRAPNPQGEDGFSVVAVGCAAISKSLAHEIGHNLGARHTRWDENISSSDDNYNFGHLSVSKAVRTIMALNERCKRQNVYCRREPHYSNPEIPYPGLSIKTGVPIGNPKAADNHAQLNATACQVAAYRQELP